MTKIHAVVAAEVAEVAVAQQAPQAKAPMRAPSTRMAKLSIQIHSMAKMMYLMPMERPIAVVAVVALRAKASKQARPLKKMALSQL
jgi:hypothetical protein